MRSTSNDYLHKQVEIPSLGTKSVVAKDLFSVATRQLVRASAVTLLVMAILVGALLGTQYLAATGIMEAMICAAGLVFLGLAVESSTPWFKPLLLTGLALPVLALLSFNQAIEFTVLAAVIVATWAATGLLKAWKL